VAEVVGCLAVRRARLVVADNEHGVIARLADGWELSQLNHGWFGGLWQGWLLTLVFCQLLVAG
jgi:hypothetical protein